MRRRRHAKIVATVGPSSSSPEKLRALFEAGVDVFRLDVSAPINMFIILAMPVKPLKSVSIFFRP